MREYCPRTQVLSVVAVAVMVLLRSRGADNLPAFGISLLFALLWLALGIYLAVYVILAVILNITSIRRLDRFVIFSVEPQ